MHGGTIMEEPRLECSWEVVSLKTVINFLVSRAETAMMLAERPDISMQTTEMLVRISSDTFFVVGELMELFMAKKQ